MLLFSLLLLFLSLLSHTCSLEYFAICLIARLEPDIVEWVEYHLRMGTSKIYLYDTSKRKDRLMFYDLQDYIHSGRVVYTIQPQAAGPGNHQGVIYTQCYTAYRHLHQFIAFLDADEFIVVKAANTSIPRALGAFAGDAALGLNWMLFGSSGRIKKPTPGVISHYSRCHEHNHVKVIANTKYLQEIDFINPHQIATKAPLRTVNELRMTIDSFWTMPSYR